MPIVRVADQLIGDEAPPTVKQGVGMPRRSRHAVSNLDGSDAAWCALVWRTHRVCTVQRAHYACSVQPDCSRRSNGSAANSRSHRTEQLSNVVTESVPWRNSFENNQHGASGTFAPRRGHPRPHAKPRWGVGHGSLATETLEQSRDRFRSGVTDNVEVIQAQDALAVANDAYIASLYSYNLAKLSLARATGVAESRYSEYLRGD